MQELNSTQTTTQQQEPGDDAGEAAADARLSVARRESDSLYAAASAALERIRTTDSESLLRNLAQSGGQ